eukprot:75820-Rhodomonas_salina.3
MPDRMSAPKPLRTLPPLRVCLLLFLLSPALLDFLPRSGPGSESLESALTAHAVRCSSSLRLPVGATG